MTGLQPAFLDPLRVEFRGYDRWALTAPLAYASRILDRVLTVPAGFTTDFASVPRWLPLAYAVAGGRGQPAAVVHDRLYQCHVVDGVEIAREVADSVFAEALQVCGEGVAIAWGMYQAVRLFGARAYRTGPQRLAALGNTETALA